MTDSLDLSLSSLLTNVWENREQILFDKSKTYNETLEDRVYDICGASRPRTQKLSGDYTLQLEKIRSIRNLQTWTQSRQDGRFGSYFVRYQSTMAFGACLSRVYLNPRLSSVYHAVNTVAELVPPILRLPAPLAQTLGARMEAAQHARGAQAPAEWSTIVLLIKIADVEEAFRARRDLIVVYLNQGMLVAERFAKLLEQKLGTQTMNPDVVPMTQRIGFGISIGAEPSGVGGASFSQIRCRLIAEALVETVTGQSKPATTRAPIPMRSVASPNRLDFVNKVRTRFASAGIDPNQPWS